jgi:drug/metabolite transporter (DMT)-like permease
MSEMTASRAANFLYLIPVIATIVGSAWLHEVPGSLGILGGGFILSGLFLVNWKRQAVPPPIPE